jgi:NAD(P)-dependent dehydrogenase (short-subunit alcohol dehydrogenase family)
MAALRLGKDMTMTSEMQTQYPLALQGRVAIVTGAAQGLGAQFALALARSGANVVVGDLSPTEAVCARIAEAGGNAIGLKLDVTDASSIKALLDVITEQFGDPDVLVNNAAISGTLKLQKLVEVQSSEWDRVMAVNVRGTFECIKAVVPYMQKGGYGKIINLSSSAALKGLPGLPHYAASKGAVIALTRASARELGADGIRVNAIAPGLTMSESMIDHPSWPPEVVAISVANRTLKREAVPHDIVGAMLFLASHDSDFMTGQTLVVDGGSVMI